MSKIIGLMVCGVGESDRYLEKPLEQFKNLCDDAVICLNGEDKKRDKLIKKYGFWSYRDDREWGLHQPSIKTDLLARIAKMKADYIMPLDADEEFADMTRDKLEELTDGARGCYFYIVNHWNDESHYHRGLSFWNIRFFKLLPAFGLQYLKKPVHCGLAPPYAYKFGTYVPHIVRHYGLMEQEDRDRKVERYKKYDPRAIHKSNLYYEAIAEKGTKVTTYDLQAINNKLKADCDRMIYQKKYKD